MWVKLSRLIITNRLYLIIVTALVTAFMAYQTKDLEMTYDFVKVVPANDPDLIYYNQFRGMFGEDGNILAIGFQDDKIFKLEAFNRFKTYCDSLAALDGVNEVVSLPNLKRLEKDTAARKFRLKPLFTGYPSTQAELDSLMAAAGNLRFYEGQLYNAETHATLAAIYIDKNVLNTSKRKDLVARIVVLSEEFSRDTGIKLHYAGLPFIRSVMVSKVQSEFKFFLVLSGIVTCLILFFIFRSAKAMVFTFLVISITVIWTTGLIVLFGYKMTLLTGMLPALIVVISIPNCIYMFNKYHQEFRRHGNKMKAISRTIEKIGFLTFMTNANTAVGFIVLLLTDVIVIREFGMIAGIISMATFLISIVVVPSLLVYLPAPTERQLQHLDKKSIRSANFFLNNLITRYRLGIHIITLVVVGVSIYGITRIKIISYMVDDLPAKSNVKSDLLFFERNFSGVMPLEISIDLGKKKAIFKMSNLKKVEEFTDYLKTEPYLSPPLSILNIVKAATQSFYNDNPAYYRLPDNFERTFIMRYFGKNDDQMGLIRSFVDSSGQTVRITMKVADVGTIETKKLLEERIAPKIKEIFGDTDFEVHVTGTTLLFLKGNQFLIEDLTSSLLIAFVLISLMMAILFTDIKMIIISVIPNVIPMLVTAGIMGFFNIPMKTSTALIFSISFGISIDSTIHYLSKFKQEMVMCRGNVLLAVRRSLKEAGISMIYTSLVLFCGFGIFLFSEFGGTVALGLLTSLTLFFAMLTNLILLPALLISFVKSQPVRRKRKGLRKAEEISSE